MALPVTTKDFLYPIPDMAVPFLTHAYSIMTSTYGGNTSRYTTEISYSVHGSSVAQDGLLLILELCLPSCSLSLTVEISS